MSGSIRGDSLVEHFDLAFVINLPERQDRLRSAGNEFERVGWTIGPTGVRLFPACRFDDPAGFPSAGIRGCFQSHYECLRTARAEEKRNVLIFEDDIALTSALPRLTPSIIRQLTDEEWDFVFFGHENTGPIEAAHSGTEEVKLVPYTAELINAHFYAVNGRVLPRLLEHLEVTASGSQSARGLVPMPLDGAYNVFRALNPDLRTLIAIPKLGWQRPSRSDLTPKMIDRARPLRPFASMLRTIKHGFLRHRR